MKNIFIVTVLVTILSYAGPTDAQPSERQGILNACARVFGPAVDPAQNLFEINELFVLQANFDKRGLLTELAVKPKYFFNESHPEWAEPYHFPLLTWDEFKSLLARLETVKAKGRLTRKANVGSVITNSTGYFKEGYVHGSLEWGEVGFRGETGNGIRFFTVRYLKRQESR